MVGEPAASQAHWVWRLDSLISPHSTRLPCWRDWGPEGAVASRPPAYPPSSSESVETVHRGRQLTFADDISTRSEGLDPGPMQQQPRLAYHDPNLKSSPGPPPGPTRPLQSFPSEGTAQPANGNGDAQGTSRRATLFPVPNFLPLSARLRSWLMEFVFLEGRYQGLARSLTNRPQGMGNDIY